MGTTTRVDKRDEPMTGRDMEKSKADRILTTTPRGDKKILSCRETLDFLSKAPYITCSGSISALVQGGCQLARPIPWWLSQVIDAVAV